jgi:hypothetical protein
MYGSYRMVGASRGGARRVGRGRIALFTVVVDCRLTMSELTPMNKTCFKCNLLEFRISPHVASYYSVVESELCAPSCPL